MKRFALSPEVPGDLGPRSVLTHGSAGMEVVQPHLLLTSWMGDDLLECFPCFFASQRLGKALIDAAVSGYVLEPAIVSVSPDASPGARKAPTMYFHWLKIVDTEGYSDFWISRDRRLVASERAMAVLERFTLEHCEREAVSNWERD